MYQEYSTLFIAQMAIQLLVGLVSNFLSLLFICFKLRVNANIKRILFSNAGFNFTGMVISTSGYFMVILYSERNLTTCTLFVLPQIISFVNSTCFIALMSTVRFKKASKASKGEIILDEHLKQLIETFSLLLGLYNIFLYILSIFDWSNEEPSVRTCANLEIGFTSGGVGNFVLALISLICSLQFDLALLRFIREKNRVQGLQLAVWTVSASQQRQHQQQPPSLILSDSVPLSSSVLSSFSVFFSFVASVTVGIIDAEGQKGFNQVIIGMFALIGALHMPLVLSLTVKSQDKETQRASSVRPPRPLQFYDSEMA